MSPITRLTVERADGTRWELTGADALALAAWVNAVIRSAPVELRYFPWRQIP